MAYEGLPRWGATENYVPSSKTLVRVIGRYVPSLILLAAFTSSPTAVILYRELY